MGMLGTNQKASLSSSLSKILEHGNTVTFKSPSASAGVEIGGGSDLAGLLEKDPEADAATMRIIISQLEALAQVWEDFEKLPLQERPKWKPRAVLIDLTTESPSYVNW